MKIQESSIQKVPDSFVLHEFTFDQIERNGMVCIYKQSLTKSGTKVAYEVVVLKEQLPNTTEIAGKKVEFAHKEVYPSAAQWGRRGWSYVQLENAQEKMGKVVKLIQEGMKF